MPPIPSPATSGGGYTKPEVRSESSPGGALKQSFPEVKKAIAKPPKKRKGKNSWQYTLLNDSVKAITYFKV